MIPNWKGDGICDDETNNCGCEWDGGDCCGINANTHHFHCSVCECLEPTVDCCEPEGDKYYLLVKYYVFATAMPI